MQNEANKEEAEEKKKEIKPDSAIFLEKEGKRLASTSNQEI